MATAVAPDREAKVRAAERDSDAVPAPRRDFNADVRIRWVRALLPWRSPADGTPLSDASWPKSQVGSPLVNANANANVNATANAKAKANAKANGGAPDPGGLSRLHGWWLGRDPPGEALAPAQHVFFFLFFPHI